MRISAEFVDKATQILASADYADRASQDVVENQCGYGESRENGPMLSRTTT